MTEQEFLEQKANLEKEIAYFEQARTTWGEPPKTVIAELKQILARRIAKWEKQNSVSDAKNDD